MRFRPYSSPEFPNDNHQLHLGASWVCLSTTGLPRAVMRVTQHPTEQALTPLPPSVAEVTAESIVFAPGSKIPLPPASIVLNVMQRSADGMGFTIRVADPQLWNEWARPAPTDELHLTEGPGPLLSQLLERFDSLDFSAPPEAAVEEKSDESPTTHRSAADELDAPPPVLEPEASVPPPVAELMESLPPSTPMNEGQFEADDRALRLELFEVLKTLEIIDSETEFAAAPPSGVQATPIISRSAVDDLADAVAEALCAEFGVSAAAAESAASVADPIPAELDVASEQSPPSLAPNHYADFVAALCDVALESGATRAAAVLPRILEGKLLDASALTDEVLETVQRAGIATLRGSCIEPTDDFKANANAWNRVLSGASDDLSGCGDTLDGFAASLLGALLGSSSDPKQLRRELRKRGVAAFGMLSVAA